MIAIITQIIKNKNKNKILEGIKIDRNIIKFCLKKKRKWRIKKYFFKRIHWKKTIPNNSC